MDGYKVTSKAEAWEVLANAIRTGFAREVDLFVNVTNALLDQIEEARDQARDLPEDRPEYQQLLVENFDREQFGLMPTIAGRVRVLDDLLRLITSLERDLNQIGG